MRHACTYDIVVVGGGVIGASVAYHLSRERDLSIALLDRKKPGNASRASAGGLWPIGESVGLGCGVIFFKTLSRRRAENPDADTEDLPDIGRPHQLPPFFFDFCLRANAMFPALWRELREVCGVDFELQATGLHYVMFDEHDQAYARQIYDSIPHLHDRMYWLDRSELAEREPYVSDEAIGALHFTGDDQVNPYLLVQAYLRGAIENGVDHFHDTEVAAVHTRGGRVLAVESDAGQVFSCGLMINAAGAWAADITEMTWGQRIPVEPVKGQIVLSEKLPRILRACISTSDCYIAQKQNGEVLIGSTTEHKGFDTSSDIVSLRGLGRGALRCLPILERMTVKRTWAGLRPGTPDEIPILGPVPHVDGYLNACGHFRTGILTSSITGQILDDLVRDREPPIELEPFLASRFDDAVPAEPAEPVVERDVEHDDRQDSEEMLSASPSSPSPA